MFSRKLLFLVAAFLPVIAFLFSTKSLKDEDTKPHQWPGRNNTVLFLSNSEHGLANVLLATSHAMLVEHQDIEVHYVSFEGLAEDVATLSRFARQTSPDVRPIKFHALKGTTYGAALNSVGHFIDETIGAPGVAGIAKLCSDLQKYLMPWTGPEYLALYQEITSILEEVDPAMVAVDSQIGPGLDAIRTLGLQHAILTPNALKDNFADRQPWGAVLWKYPCIGSGYTYPVPWHLIPANIYLTLRLAYSVTWTPELTRKKSYLKENGIANPLDFFSVYNKDLVWLTQSSPDADFPMSIIPSNVVACGPIFLSTATAVEQDKELATWLQKAPTVLVNLGSTVNYDKKAATEMARAVKELLETSGVQVLWKFNKRREFPDLFLAELQEFIAQGRLRLEKWIKIDPASLLETGNVVLSVHHGGANCYHEAVGTGIPQMVLPMWVDLYDYATRAEFLGIGVWGNKNSAPYWTAEELGIAFQRVLGDGETATSIRKKAADLGGVSKKDPGRFVAARELAKHARLIVGHVETP
ncbi:hypothetical protein ACLOAV_001744 [Pseudogymnoascus australis]